MTSVRHPPPRQLGASESLESLTHWENTFRTYFKRDDSYKKFLRSTASWNPQAINYGQASENTGLERSAAEMKEDLVDLLSTLAGFLPHPYLTTKLLKNTTNWTDVWNIIREHYGVQVSGESLLDFEEMYKNTGETHRQFYERLLEHARQHLAPANVKVEEVDTGAQAETMSVSVMNMVALQWLRKIDPTLVKIVKTEYSTELRKNTQLAALVPRIAPNINSLLARYNSGATCNKVHMDMDENAMDSYDVNKVWSKQNTQSAKTRQNQPTDARSRQTKPRGPFCPACYYLSQQLQTALHFKHLPNDCPRKTVAINMLKMEDNEHFETFGNTHYSPVSLNICDNSQAQRTNNQQDSSEYGLNIGKSNFINNCVQPSYENEIQHKINYTEAEHEMDCIISEPNNSENNLSTTIGDDSSSISSLAAAVYKLESRHLQSNTVRKKKSPVISVTTNNRPALATIDEGSEINCLDEGFATRLNIIFVPTACKATAAGSSRMKLVGQTLNDVILYPQGTTDTVCWNLGKAVVVTNLGVDILIGEPGKQLYLTKKLWSLMVKITTRLNCRTIQNNKLITFLPAGLLFLPFYTRGIP